MQDTDRDGRFDVTIVYDEGRARSRVEEDANGDGKLDLVTVYAGEQIARREADTDANGSLDTVSTYEKGKEAAPDPRSRRQRRVRPGR